MDLVYTHFVARYVTKNAVISKFTAKFLTTVKVRLSNTRPRVHYCLNIDLALSSTSFLIFG